MTTGFDSPMIISHFVSLIAVPVSASTGTGGNIKLICKETNLCKCHSNFSWTILSKG